MNSKVLVANDEVPIAIIKKVFAVCQLERYTPEITTPVWEIGDDQDETIIVCYYRAPFLIIFGITQTNLNGARFLARV